MRRALALLVLSATSWSYVAALHCGMGAEGADALAGPPHGAGGTHHYAADARDAQAHTHVRDAAQHHHPDSEPGHAPATGHSHRDGSGDRCLMVMTCGPVTSAPSARPAVRQPPTQVKRVVAVATPVPDAAAPVLDPPPPRRSV